MKEQAQSTFICWGSREGVTFITLLGENLFYTLERQAKAEVQSRLLQHQRGAKQNDFRLIAKGRTCNQNLSYKKHCKHFVPQKR